MQNFRALFSNELKRIYSAENQQLKAFQSIINATSHENLKEAFEKHLNETKKHVERLEQIGKQLNEKITGSEGEIMKTLIKETDKVIKSDYDANTKDAALITMMQRIEHYEITSYGILKAYAKHFNLDAVEKLLDLTSKEEGAFNRELIEIAQGKVWKKGVNTDAREKAA
jgi:ferritin-like metal-binding protein YciE